MARQISLIPVSQAELNSSAYRVAELLEEMDEAEANFDEAKKSHKEHMGKLRTEIREHRTTIRRAKDEQDEGLMSAQVDVLFRQAEETRE